jgi:hypothetical protein
MPLDRRTLLKILASSAATGQALLAPMFAAAAASEGGIQPADFAALSSVLTGYPPEDAAVASRIFAAFDTPEKKIALAQLSRLLAETPKTGIDAAIRERGLEPLANELVAAWYSGVVKNAQGEQLVIYTEALMWKAMSFAKPMGVCGGAFGHWADPPA